MYSEFQRVVIASSLLAGVKSMTSGKYDNSAEPWHFTDTGILRFVRTEKGGSTFSMEFEKDKIRIDSDAVKVKAHVLRAVEWSPAEVIFSGHDKNRLNMVDQLTFIGFALKLFGKSANNRYVNSKYFENLVEMLVTGKNLDQLSARKISVNVRAEALRNLLLM